MAPRHLTIRTKLLVSIIPAVSVLAAITVMLLTTYFKASTKAAVEKQQYTLATLMASKLDDQLDLYRKAIVSLAQNIPKSILNNPAALEHYLDADPDLLQIFDNNVAVFTPKGILLAETGCRPSRTGLDLSYRDYIIKTRKNWQPAISSPFRIQLPGSPPVVMFTAPIRDEKGVPLAIVGGSISLLHPNLLGKLATTKIGENGYFYLADTDRTLIMHPDQNRILKTTAKPGVNRLFDKAMKGFEGAGETVNSYGITMLVAYKRLATTNWILAAQLPISEAYAPVVMAEEVGWGIALFALFLLGMLITVASSRLLAPLQNLTTQIAQINVAEKTELLPLTGNDEISKLSTSFNSLLMQLKARERDLQNSRELYQFISDFSTDWIFWRVPSGEMLYISPAAERISGYRVDELLADATLISAMIHPDDRPIWDQHVCHVDQTTAPQAIEFRIITKQGHIRWLRHSCMPILDADGTLIGIRGSNDDITERTETLLTLQESEARFRLIANAAHDAIVMVDQEQTITLWNPSAERLFGMPAEKALATRLPSFIPDLFETIAKAGGIPAEGLRLEILGRTAQGAALMLELSLSRANISGNVFTVMLARDITERKKMEQQLKYSSQHDALTGLQNRAAFEYHRERLDQEGPFPVSVIMADLDGLKEINDCFGHEVGDQLITAAAALLVVPFRTQDIVARLGGDEFVVLLPGMKAEVAAAKIAWLRAKIAAAQKEPGKPAVSFSLGMAVASGPGQLTDTIAQADQQMYADKFAKRELPEGALPPSHRS